MQFKAVNMMKALSTFVLAIAILGAFSAEESVVADKVKLDALVALALDTDLEKSEIAVAEIKKLGDAACIYASPKLMSLVQRPVVVGGKFDTDERMAALLVVLRSSQVKMKDSDLQRLKVLTTHENSVISSFASIVYENQINAAK